MWWLHNTVSTIFTHVTDWSAKQFSMFIPLSVSWHVAYETIEDGQIHIPFLPDLIEWFERGSSTYCEKIHFLKNNSPIFFSLSIILSFLGRLTWSLTALSTSLRGLCPAERNPHTLDASLPPRCRQSPAVQRRWCLPNPPWTAPSWCSFLQILNVQGTKGN